MRSYHSLLCFSALETAGPSVPRTAPPTRSERTFTRSRLRATPRSVAVLSMADCILSRDIDRNCVQSREGGRVADWRKWTPHCSCEGVTRLASTIEKQPFAGPGRVAARCGGVSGRWPGLRPRTSRGITSGVDTTVRENGEDTRRRMRPNPHTRKLESTRGEICHRVRHHWDIHRKSHPCDPTRGGVQCVPFVFLSSILIASIISPLCSLMKPFTV